MISTLREFTKKHFQTFTVPKQNEPLLFCFRISFTQSRPSSSVFSVSFRSCLALFTRTEKRSTRGASEHRRKSRFRRRKTDHPTRRQTSKLWRLRRHTRRSHQLAEIRAHSSERKEILRELPGRRHDRGLRKRNKPQTEGRQAQLLCRSRQTLEHTLPTLSVHTLSPKQPLHGKAGGKHLLPQRTIPLGALLPTQLRHQRTRPVGTRRHRHGDRRNRETHGDRTTAQNDCDFARRKNHCRGSLGQQHGRTHRHLLSESERMETRSLHRH